MAGDVPTAKLQDGPDEHDSYLDKAAGYLGEIASEPVTLLTVVLIVVLIYHALLFRGTLKATEQAVMVARITADAAKESADAARHNTQTLVALESPKVVVHRPLVRSGGHTYSDLQPGASITCTVANYGRTPAFVVSHCMEFAVVGRLPADPKYGTVETLRDIAPLDDRTTPYSLDSKWVAFLTEDQLRDVRAGITPLWLYGFVTFQDFLRDTWRVGFCYRWVEQDRWGHSGFVPVSLPHYSYYRKEE